MLFVAKPIGKPSKPSSTRNDGEGRDIRAAMSASSTIGFVNFPETMPEKLTNSVCNTVLFQT